MPENPQYPQVSQDDALKHIDNNGVAIYWRPGCPFCERLEYGLGEDGQKATWINIWEDPAAKEYVASSTMAIPRFPRWSPRTPISSRRIRMHLTRFVNCWPTPPPRPQTEGVSTGNHRKQDDSWLITTILRKTSSSWVS